MSAPAPTGVLVMAHGTPPRLEDVGAFYTEIRRGRPPTPGQLADLERRYRAIGGPSPLNAVTRAQAAGIAAALSARAPGRWVVRHGSRFADPRIEEAAADLQRAGADPVVGLVMAPHSSRLSVGEYERRGRAALGEGTALVMVDHWFDAPGFAALVARRVTGALGALAQPESATVVFSAHAVPVAADGDGDYRRQVERSAADAAAAAGLGRHRVAWQSAGRTDDEWLGPDLLTVLREEAAAGASGLVVCPIGFTADHLEVLYDIDIEARAVAEEAGVAFARTASFNAAADFCELIAGVVAAAVGAGR
ncbi:MAG: ferrochelatase [Acidimicrobiales bacterium]